MSEIGGKQPPLKRLLLAGRTFNIGPVQQPMGIEGVVDAITRIYLEVKANLGTALANRRACLHLLVRRRTVLLKDMFADVLAAEWHLRI